MNSVSTLHTTHRGNPARPQPLSSLTAPPTNPTSFHHWCHFSSWNTTNLPQGKDFYSFCSPSLEGPTPKAQTFPPVRAVSNNQYLPSSLTSPGSFFSGICHYLESNVYVIHTFTLLVSLLTRRNPLRARILSGFFHH